MSFSRLSGIKLLTPHHRTHQLVNQAFANQVLVLLDLLRKYPVCLGKQMRIIVPTVPSVPNTAICSDFARDGLANVTVPAPPSLSRNDSPVLQGFLPSRDSRDDGDGYLRQE